MLKRFADLEVNDKVYGVVLRNGLCHGYFVLRVASFVKDSSNIKVSLHARIDEGTVCGFSITGQTLPTSFTIIRLGFAETTKTFGDYCFHFFTMKQDMLAMFNDSFKYNLRLLKEMKNCVYHAVK